MTAKKAKKAPAKKAPTKAKKSLRESLPQKERRIYQESFRVTEKEHAAFVEDATKKGFSEMTAYWRSRLGLKA